MSETFIGWIAKLSSREGKWNKSAYSAKVLKEDGTEYPQWFRFGFLASSPVEEGDYVKLLASEVTDKYVTVDKVIKGNKPAPKAVGNSGPGGSNGSGGTSAGSPSAPYNSDVASAQRAYHAARGTAVEFISACLQAGAFPLPAVTQKAGKAKAFELLTEAVDKMTVKYFRDAMPEFEGTYRLLETVEDAGTEKEDKTAPLPDDTAEEDDGFADTGEDGFPPEDDDGFPE